MSFPTIPDVSPAIDVDRCDAINLLLSSIALEEISLSKILTSQSEVLQAFTQKGSLTIEEFVILNDSVQKVLRQVMQTEAVLQLKLMDVSRLAEACDCCDGDGLARDEE